MRSFRVFKDKVDAIMVQMETQISTMLAKSRSGESTEFQTTLNNVKNFTSGYESTDIFVSDVDKDVNNLQDNLLKCYFDPNLTEDLLKGSHIPIQMFV